MVLVTSRHDEATASLAKAARAVRVVIVPESDSPPGPVVAEQTSSAVVGDANLPAEDGGLWIVEDSRAVRLLVRHAFEREGWSVREFENLASAQEAARLAATAARERPHAVVLDIHLPDGNGLDNVRRFAATCALTR